MRRDVETLEVSQGGAFVGGNHPLASDSVLELRFGIESGDPVDLLAKVVHIVGEDSRYEPGFGVQWLEARAPAGRERLRRFLRETLGLRDALVPVTERGATAIFTFPTPLAVDQGTYEELVPETVPSSPDELGQVVRLVRAGLSLEDATKEFLAHRQAEAAAKKVVRDPTPKPPQPIPVRNSRGNAIVGTPEYQDDLSPVERTLAAVTVPADVPSPDWLQHTVPDSSAGRRTSAPRKTQIASASMTTGSFPAMKPAGAAALAQGADAARDSTSSGATTGNYSPIVPRVRSRGHAAPATKGRPSEPPNAAPTTAKAPAPAAAPTAVPRPPVVVDESTAKMDRQAVRSAARANAAKLSTATEREAKRRRMLSELDPFEVPSNANPFANAPARKCQPAGTLDDLDLPDSAPPAKRRAIVSTSPQGAAITDASLDPAFIGTQSNVRLDRSALRRLSERHRVSERKRRSESRDLGESGRSST